MANKEDFDLVVYSALTAIEDAKEVGKKYENQARKLQDKAFDTWDDFQKATGQAHEAILKKSLWSGIFFFFGVLAVLALGVFGVTWYTKELRKEVAQLQEQAEYFKKNGGKARVTTCGDENRLCIEVDTEKKFGEKGETFYIIKGY